MFEQPRRIHLVGAGGAGMSALGKLLLQIGHLVSGSDLRHSEELVALSDLGATVWTGSKPELVTTVDLLVASSAVPASDPEVRAAVAAGITCWQRPQLLMALTESVPTIGATGTHGKTTSAALLLFGLRHIGLDPSFVIGGQMLDLRTNAHHGNDDLLVLEADEAFRTFESLHLRGLQVTNVDSDHLEHFGSIEALEDSFAYVARQVEGPVVACADDPGSARLAAKTGAITYGTDPTSNWHLSDVDSQAAAVGFTLANATDEARVVVGKPGLHTARNAAGALALLGELGYSWQGAAAGLAAFGGVQRRYETKGQVSGVTFVDDYAHHPEEVAATLETAKAGSWKRVWAVFQPHLYSRTQLHFQQFGEALAKADLVVVTDVYGSRETPVPGVTGELVAAAVGAAGGNLVAYLKHRADVAPYLAEQVRAGDLVLTMGAGDINLVAAELGPLLEQRVSP